MFILFAKMYITNKFENEPIDPEPVLGFKGGTILLKRVWSLLSVNICVMVIDYSIIDPFN